VERGEIVVDCCEVLDVLRNCSYGHMIIIPYFSILGSIASPVF
jgi:hypothetical protein